MRFICLLVNVMMFVSIPIFHAQLFAHLRLAPVSSVFAAATAGRHRRIRVGAVRPRRRETARGLERA